MFGGNARNGPYEGRSGYGGYRTTYYSQNARRNAGRRGYGDSYTDSVLKTASRTERDVYTPEEILRGVYRAPEVSDTYDLMELRDYLTSEFGGSGEYVDYCVRTYRADYTDRFGVDGTVLVNLANICHAKGLAVSEGDLRSIAARLVEKARE